MSKFAVAPRAGAWIEINLSRPRTNRISSLPVRERGLKSVYFSQLSQHSVAPRAGAWIEIVVEIIAYVLAAVAPRAGAWIEIGFLWCARSG